MDTKTAVFSFDTDLLALLPKGLRVPRYHYSFTGPQSAKHLVESLGIPHTEIGEIVVDGRPQSMSYLVENGDMVEVRGVQPLGRAAAAPAFAADGHLRRLAAGLRMLGLDTYYGRDDDDRHLIDTSSAEGRNLLTRDRRLLMHKAVTQGYLVRALDPWEQLVEVSRRFDLGGYARPLSRCIRCNHVLERVEKQAILDRLQPLTRLYFDEFRQCPACEQVYWRGSHVDRMLAKISSLIPSGKGPQSV